MERFRVDHGDMFSKPGMGRLPEWRNKQVFDAVAGLADEDVLNVNEEDYIKYLIDEFTLYMPVVHFENVSVTPRKVLVDPEYLPSYWGAQEAVECAIWRFVVPVTGDYKLLYFKPSELIISGGGFFHIGRDELFVDVLALNNDAKQVRNEYESRKSDCLKMLGNLEKDVRQFNDSLPRLARRYFLIRKEKIKSENTFLVELGVPLSSQVKSSGTYAVPTVSHRFAPPKIRSAKTIEVSTPIMDRAKYELILEAIQRVGQEYEKHPHVTRGMDEETLRDLFLAQIQASFESEATTAEAFNNRGKTDIMVKHGDGIVFIAECKFWKGKRMLHDAISQLLSYMTWRETKAALLIFVRNTTMTTAISVVKDYMSTHENYKNTLSPKGETWLNYKFTLPSDIEREVYLAVQLFDFK